jgi:hypothetical protein
VIVGPPVPSGPVQPIWVSTPLGDQEINATSITGGALEAIMSTTRGVRGPGTVFRSDSLINGQPGPGGNPLGCLTGGGCCPEAGCSGIHAATDSSNQTPSSSPVTCPYSDMNDCYNPSVVANYDVSCDTGACDQITGTGLFHVFQPTGYDPNGYWVQWGFAEDTNISRKGNCQLENGINTWDDTNPDEQVLLDYSPQGTNTNGASSSYHVSASYVPGSGGSFNFGWDRSWSDSGKLEGGSGGATGGTYTYATWHTMDSFCPDGNRNVLNAGIWEIPNGDAMDYKLWWKSSS